MKDVPVAHKKIKAAIKLDQLSVASYGIGGLLTLSGFATLRQNNELSSKLLKAGGYGLGAGIVFQILQTKFKRQAVAIYNSAVLKQSHVSKTNFTISLSGNNIVVSLSF